MSLRNACLEWVNSPAAAVITKVVKEDDQSFNCSLSHCIISLFGLGQNASWASRHSKKWWKLIICCLTVVQGR